MREQEKRGEGAEKAIQGSRKSVARGMRKRYEGGENAWQGADKAIEREGNAWRCRDGNVGTQKK